MKKATAPSAEAGAAAPAPKANPLHQPTPRRPRDQFTGQGGTYARDPITGERTPVSPPASPAEGADTATA